MAILRLKEIRGMDTGQIDDKIKELYAEYSKMRSQVRSGGAPENSGKMGNIRKTIARLLTIKSQKEKAGEAPKAEKPKSEKPKEKAAKPVEKKAEKAEKKAEKPKAAKAAPKKI